MSKPKIALAMLVVIIITSSTIAQIKAWSNGGYSTDPAHPAYGTHDWVAQHALDWLPANEKQYITDNLAAYFYGTELPDNSNASAPGHIGDTSKHHIYYRSTGALQDDAAAVRASAEYQTALNRLNARNYSGAALTAGIMSHYIADQAVFAHVMGASTDWGAETRNVHSNYESYVDTRTNTYSDTYNTYLSFDGNLQAISAYDAAKNLAYDTTFDHGGTYTCVWMNNNYDTSNPNSPYWFRAGKSFNLAVNAVADVLHTLYVSSNVQSTPTPTPAATPTPTPTLTPSPSPTTSLSPSSSPTTTLTTTPSPTTALTPTPTTQTSTSPTLPPTNTPTASAPQPSQAPLETSSQNPPASPAISPAIPEYPAAAMTALIVIVASATTTVALKNRQSEKNA